MAQHKMQVGEAAAAQAPQAWRIRASNIMDALRYPKIFIM
jgi:hypothetical protein